MSARVEKHECTPKNLRNFLLWPPVFGLLIIMCTAHACFTHNFMVSCVVNA